MNNKSDTVKNASHRVERIPICTKTYSIGIGLVLAFGLLLPIVFFGTPPQQYKWTFFLAAGVLCSSGFCILMAYLVFRDKFALMIDDRGIHERFLTGRRSILWDNIVSIGISRSAQGNNVAFRYKSGSSGRWFTFGQYDAWLGNSYSIDNNQLLKILADWKDTTTAAPS